MDFSVLDRLSLYDRKRLEETSICILGCGGLGSNVIPLLAFSGVGRVVLVDFDVVEEGNLHRQTLYSVADIGESKANCARDFILQRHPNLTVEVVNSRISTFADCEAIFSSLDLVLDCTDNQETRFLLSDYCQMNGIPLLHGACVQWSGQVVLLCGDGRPCLRCFTRPQSEPRRAATHGVSNTAVGLVGATMAAVAIEFLLKFDLESTLFIIDARTCRFREVRLKRRKECEICSNAKS